MKKQLTLKTKKVSKLTQNGSGEQNQKLTPFVVYTSQYITPLFN